MKVWYYVCYANQKFIAMNYIEGKSLEHYLKQNSLTLVQKKNFVLQLETIAKTLLETNIIHRDIRPANFIVTQDEQLILIDAQFAVNYKNYKETHFIKNNPYCISGLGMDFALGRFQWDDMYSLNKITEIIGYPSEYIRSNIGKVRVRFPRYYYIKARLKKVKKIFTISYLKKKLRKIKLLSILFV